MEFIIYNYAAEMNFLRIYCGGFLTRATSCTVSTN